MATHPYLVWSLALCGLLGVALALRPRHRRLALVSATLSAPFSILAVVFVPAYWEPVQVFRFLLGPEDLLFSFANGGIVWILAAGRCGELDDRLSLRTYGKRCARVSAVFLPAWLAVSWLGLPIMWAALLTGLGLWVFLIRRNREALPASLQGAAVFGTGYTALLAALLHLNPSFASSWPDDGVLDLKVLAVPLEEILWAVEFGAIWPLLLVYFLGIQRRQGVAALATPA